MKKVMYVVIGLLVVYLILCLFGPSSMKVERSIDVKTSSVSDLQHKLADFKFFHDVWSPWTRIDPNMKTTYTGASGEPGSKYSWESEKDSAGIGSMTSNGFNGDSVLITVNFKGMGDSKIYYITKPVNESINVTWGMIFDIGFFGRGPMLFFSKKMDKNMGDIFERGLAKLKDAIEKMPVASTYDIKEINWEAQSYLGKKGTCKFIELPKFFGENYQKLMTYFTENKLKMYGPPSAIYFNMDYAKMETEVAAVFIIRDKVKSKDLETFEIPASKVLMLEYYGDYQKMMSAYQAMDEYMAKKGLTKNVAVEEYVTDPMTEKDTAKWLTNIYYVLK